MAGTTAGAASLYAHRSFPRDGDDGRGRAAAAPLSASDFTVPTDSADHPAAPGRRWTAESPLKVKP